MCAAHRHDVRAALVAELDAVAALVTRAPVPTLAKIRAALEDLGEALDTTRAGAPVAALPEGGRL